MREGILNAIVHRDYNAINGFLQISVFPDRTEISNYGGLPDGVTLKDLKTEHHSILRNPDIAQMAFVRKYVELLGSGTLRMIRDCRQNKFPVPVWKEKDNIITALFYKVGHNRPVDEDIIEGVEDISKETIKWLEGITEGITEEVKDKIKKILLVIHDSEGIRTTNIGQKADTPSKSVERYLKLLRDNDIIEFRGANRTGGYYIKQKK
jgi:ATP-dependent DNA helicase RecG